MKNDIDTSRSWENRKSKDNNIERREGEDFKTKARKSKGESGKETKKSKKN